MAKEETDLRERTKEFALRIFRMFSALPKTTEAQVLRSGTSVGANYREAFRGRSKAHQLFGAQLPSILDELNLKLVA